nr:S-layer homology domain-containing protein [Ohessyouella blattaphilus]
MLTLCVYTSSKAQDNANYLDTQTEVKELKTVNEDVREIVDKAQNIVDISGQGDVDLSVEALAEYFVSEESFQQNAILDATSQSSSADFFHKLNPKAFGVLTLTNAYRRIYGNGADALGTSEALTRAAAKRAGELNVKFDHDRPDGTSCFSVLSEFDISANSAGENIAWGASNSTDALGLWMNSEGHRNNILQSGFSALGAGENNYRWVQFFIGTAAPSSISVSNDYIYVVNRGKGEVIDHLGIALETQVGNDTYYVPVTESMCSGFNYNTKGYQTVTVNYKGKATTFTLLVHPFVDVAENAWFFGSVMKVNVAGIMNGMNANSFGPNVGLARAQLAVMLHRLEGQPAVTYTNRFSDVAKGQWYTNAVLWAAQNGVVNGYEDGRFGVGDNINREQIAAMLYNYSKYKGYDVNYTADLHQFPDCESVSEYAVKTMQWAVGMGIIKGVNGYIQPSSLAVRAQAAAIMVTYLGL